MTEMANERKFQEQNPGGLIRLVLNEAAEENLQPQIL